MKNLLWILTLALIVVMPTQWGVHVGGTTRTVTRQTEQVQDDGTVKIVETKNAKREGGIHVTPGDALLVVVFALWAAYVIFRRKLFEVRLPFLAVFALLAVVLASVIRSKAWGSGMREFLQLGAYFVGGWLVFANCITTRRRLRAAVDLFSIVVAAIVVVALYQYRGAVKGNVFEVGGSFGNRNVLGAFLAISLPFVFALALYEKRLWQRFALALAVALGAMVTLSGGALIAIAVALLFVAGAKSQKALLGVLIATALALTLLPDTLYLPRHSDIVISSVNPYLSNNFLDRRKGEPEPYEEPVVATRYKRWYAASRRIQDPAASLLGAGPGKYSQTVAAYYGSVEKPSGDTDHVPGFNIEADEPDTFNMYLVTCVEAGPLALVALIWVGVLFLGRNLRNHGKSGDEFGKALALGAAGALVGAAVCAVFSNILVRGVAMPFIFVALSGILWAKLPDSPEPEQSR